MPIAIETLLRVANFSTEKIDQFMSFIDYVPEDEKLRLSNTAWSFIGAKHFTALNLYKHEILQEVEQGKRKPNPNDITEIEARLIYELAQKLGAADSEKCIEEVRQQLERYKKGIFLEK